ncbi:MAG: AbrB/MazE/SpoVT family DNA-binding domain-containing protein [Verrucomicrobiaceae bacterium]|nr:AbrB/MazE/SpoVT family DNA-binding domain-containing protein [Verrucomicrobiaceae bacterium]
MSMTITMNEAGRLTLPESVRVMFGLAGGQRIELDVQDDGVKLRFEHPAAAEAPLGRIETRHGRRVIVPPVAVTSQDIVKAIKADRNERTDKIAHRPRASL